jgi:hypothetical protein
MSRLAPLSVAAMLACLTTPAGAQGWFSSQRTFSLYEENDAISATGDDSYTQGIRVTWDFLEWPALAHHLERGLSIRGIVNRLPGFRVQEVSDRCAPQRTRGTPPTPCGSVSFGIGQTIFTPADIRASVLQPHDRPYAGWLFANLGVNVRDGAWQSSTDLVMGMIGPQSHAQSTQSLAHWTWAQGSPMPRGWHHQLRNAFHVGLIHSIGHHVVEFCRAGRCTGAYDEQRWFDLTPKAELITATFMRRAGVGATARIGNRFPDALVGQRIPATGRPMEAVSRGGQQWWWAAIASAEQRAVGFNAFLEGSYADRGPGDWKAQRGIVRRIGTDEWTLGLGVGNRNGSATAQWVSRSPEWKVASGAGVASPTKRHAFVTLLFAIHAGS